MLINDLIEYFGKPSTDRELKDYLLGNDIDLTSELFLEDASDDTAYIERPSCGYCLFFTAESSFLSRNDMLVGQGALFFSGVFLYSQGVDGYDQYNDVLPHEITLDDSRAELYSKMGDSVWNRKDDSGRSIAERWDFDFHKMHITYFKDSDRIRIISISTYFGQFQPINTSVRQLEITKTVVKGSVPLSE